MYLKGIEDDINVFSVGILQLLQHLDLMQGDFNTIVLLASIDSVVVGVNINDFEGNNSVFFLVKTRE